jgi:hypothetical protein
MQIGQSENDQSPDYLARVPRLMTDFAQADDYSRLAHQVDCFCVDTDWCAGFYCPS